MILVTSKSVICRRLIKLETGKFNLKPDNPNYKESEISKKDVLEVWQVNWVISNHVEAHKNIEEKVLLMEQKLEDIVRKLDKK